VVVWVKTAKGWFRVWEKLAGGGLLPVKVWVKTAKGWFRVWEKLAGGGHGLRLPTAGFGFGRSLPVKVWVKTVNSRFRVWEKLAGGGHGLRLSTAGFWFGRSLPVKVWVKTAKGWKIWLNWLTLLKRCGIVSSLKLLKICCNVRLTHYKGGE